MSYKEKEDGKHKGKLMFPIQYQGTRDISVDNKLSVDDFIGLVQAAKVELLDSVNENYDTHNWELYVYVESVSSYSDALEMKVYRMETDDECEARKLKQYNAEKLVEERELALLAKLQAKYGDGSKGKVKGKNKSSCK